MGVLKTVLVFLVLSSQVSWAKELSNPPAERYPTLDEVHGVITTIIPQAIPLKPDQVRGEKVYTLSDGTRVPTLFYPGTAPAPRPLIMINFGMFTDKGSGALGRFVRQLVLTDKLGADLLVVSSNTSGTFYHENKEYGLGGYDEGRILVGLAEQIRANHFENSSIELVGVSLGGNAVLQALIEDERLGRHDFQSAITFSAVVDQASSTESLLSTFGHPLDLPAGPALSDGGAILAKGLILRLKKTLKSEGEDSTFPMSGTGDIFYSNFTRRLSRLSDRSDLRDTWNSQVSLKSVEDYVTTSSDLIAANINTVKVPVILVHAQNDPLVPFEQFEKFADREESSQTISTLATEQGGHFGFASAYGDDWMNGLIIRARGGN